MPFRLSARWEWYTLYACPENSATAMVPAVPPPRLLFSLRLSMPHRSPPILTFFHQGEGAQFLWG
jgi:hypothetical protein